MVTSLFSSGAHAFKPWSTYTVSGFINYIDLELKEPFQAWYDETQNASRIDYYNGWTLIFSYV